jgi:hypothetical protein
MQGNRRLNELTHDSALYQIKLQGQLDESWSTWFDDMVVTLDCEEEGLVITTLTGVVSDQPALYGLLSRIRDLGLLLLSVQRLKNHPL